MKPLLALVNSVLFDLDGTLVDTHIDFALMKREMAALALKAGLSPEDIEGLDILGMVDAAVNFLNYAARTDEARQAHHRAMCILRDIELRHAHETEPIPFASELIGHLRARGIGIGVVTRNCREASELSLSIARISPDVLICREDCDNHKPHPEPILLALARLNATPGNSIMVGDHIMDVQAGRAAGMKTIGFLREDRPDDFFDAVCPDVVTRSLREVLGAIIDSAR